jgi:hypothetical protein
MQKVEGSNPFSRSQKACICRPFSWTQSLVRLRRRAPSGHPAGQHAAGASQNKPVCRHFLMTRTIDLLSMASASDAVSGGACLIASHAPSSSDAGARDGTIDTCACVCTRERRFLSCGARSRAMSSGGFERDRSRQRGRSFDGASLWWRLGPACESACVERPGGGCAGSAPSISAAIRRAARVPPQAQLSRPRRNRSRCRATGSRARGLQWSGSSSSPLAEESPPPSCARAAARRGRRAAPCGAACPG